MKKIFFLFALPLLVFGQHPNLLLNSATLSYLNSKATDGSTGQAEFTAMKNWVNSYPADWDSMFGAALMYAMNPTTYASYGTQACSQLYTHLTTSTDPIGAYDGGHAYQLNTMRWYNWAVPIVYDWAYNACTTTQLSKMEEFMTTVTNYNNGGGGYWNGGQYINNLFMGQLKFNAYSAAAMNNATWLAAVIAKFRATSEPLITSGYAQGAVWPEGAEYEPETKYILVDVLEAVKGASGGTDLFAEVPNLMTDLIGMRAKGLSPSLAFAYPYNDSQSAGSPAWDLTFHPPDLQELLRTVYHFNSVSDATHAGWAKQYMNLTSLPTSFNYDTLAEIFFYDRSVTPVDYTATETTNWVTPNALITRKDWSSTTSWLGLSAQPSGFDHVPQSQGEFIIYRNGTWLVRGSQGYPSTASGNAYVSGGGHSLPMLDGHFSAAGRNNSYGTIPIPFFSAAACASDDSYCVGRLDLTSNYGWANYYASPDVSSVLRDLFYLKAADVVILSDHWGLVSGVNAVDWNFVKTPALPTVSGNVATVTSGTQQMNLTVVTPSSGIVRSEADNYLRIYFARKIDDSNMFLYTNGAHFLSTGGSITLSGGTGAWAALNGTWTVTVPTTNSQATPFKDGSGYDMERVKITGTSAFAGITAWDPTQSIVTTIAKNYYVQGVVTPLYHVAISSGASTNQESQFLVMELANSTETPTAMTSASTASVNAVSFTKGSQSYIIATPKANGDGLPLSYSYGGGTVQHYVIGVTPSAAYKVDRSVAGQVTITAAGGGSDDVTATAAGVLSYGTGETITPTLTVNPTAISFDYTSGIPGGIRQTLDIESNVAGTLVSLSAADSWLQVSVGVVTAPQMITVSANPGSLPPGNYTSLLTLQCTPACSGGAATISVTLTIHQTVRGVVSSPTAAVVFYNAPSVSACGVQASLDPLFGSIIPDRDPQIYPGADSDGGGIKPRMVILGENAGLSPAMTYYFRATCAGAQTGGSFTTRPAAVPVASQFALSAKPPAYLGAATLRLWYGSSFSSLNQSQQMSCISGCVIRITENAGDRVYFRQEWLDSKGNTLASGTPRATVIQ